MKKISTLGQTILGVLIALGSAIDLQSQHCGTVLTDPTDIDIETLRHYVKSNRHQRSAAEISIGITIHIVEEVSGAANIELSQLYNELDAVNQIYTSSGFEFFFCGSPRTITGGKSIYTYTEAADLLNSRYHVPNTINIFYLDEIGDQQLSNFACGISTFPFNSTPETRFIIMQKDCSTNGSTLAHEIGHFFGLLHTHETAVGVELVNGSNCDSAGDLICDTPADPNLALTGLSGCSYTARYTDANGDLYRPDPSNIMSYAPASCRRKFSNEQNATMNYWYETELSYLVSQCDQFPDYAINSTQDVVSISSGQKIDLDLAFEEFGVNPPQKIAFEVLLLSESQVLPFIIYRDSIIFNGEVSAFVENLKIPIPLTSVTGSYLLTIILDPDGEILERDKRNNIFTLELTIDNSSYSDVTLFPNPANEFIRFFLRGKVTGKAFISINDLLGREYFTKQYFKSEEEFFNEISLTGLQPGFYILTISFENSDNQQSYLFLKD